MDRRTIPIKLKDGNTYYFSERNKEDSDYWRYQDKVRAHKINFIQQHVENIDTQLALIMIEMDKTYSVNEINFYIASNEDELKIIAYDSFKIKNPEISFEEFTSLLTDVNMIISLIDKLEDNGIKKKELL